MIIAILGVYFFVVGAFPDRILFLSHTKAPCHVEAVSFLLAVMPIPMSNNCDST